MHLISCHLCVTLALLCSAVASAHALDGVVVGVSDGDTITVLDTEKHQHKIRLLGIDAPEKRQAFGDKSKQNLSSMVFGLSVLVEWKKRDRYGRIVGKVLAQEQGCKGEPCLRSRDICKAQVEAGLAWHYKAYAKEQSALDRRSYAEAEDEAKSAIIGLWRASNPVPPWEFRSNRNQ